MVLAIGIVVDDAIVVLENVERIMREEKLPPREAAIKAMREVTGPIIAIVLVLCAVFVPVAFLGGLTGELYRQFAVTIAIAVVISGIVALTLTPALCALLLKPARATESRFFRRFNRWLRARHRALSSTASLAAAHAACSRSLLFVGMVARRPRWLLRAYAGQLRARRGPGLLHRRGDPARRRDARAHRQGRRRRCAEAIALEPGDRGRHRRSPASTSSAAASATTRRRSSSRRSTGTSASVTAPQRGRRAVRARRRAHQGGLVLAFNPPPILGLGTAGGFEFYMQNRGDGDPQAPGAGHAAVPRARCAAIRSSPGIKTLLPRRPCRSSTSTSTARRRRRSACRSTTCSTRCSARSARSTSTTSTSTAAPTGADAGRAAVPQRSPTTSAASTCARHERRDDPAEGADRPCSNIVGPEQLERFNNLPSAKVIGSGAPGVSSGEAIAAVEEIAREALPAGYTHRLERPGVPGEAHRQRVDRSRFGFAIVMVFLILAAQYERWSLPFRCCWRCRSGRSARSPSCALRGMSNDVYFQIGLVDAARPRGEERDPDRRVRARRSMRRACAPSAAALEAARLRFRPIVMTSLAFILGVLPLALSTRRRRRRAALDGHRRDRRHARRDVPRDLLRAAVLRRAVAREDPRTAGAGRGRRGCAREPMARRRDGAGARARGLHGRPELRACGAALPATYPDVPPATATSAAATGRPARLVDALRRRDTRPAGRDGAFRQPRRRAWRSPGSRRPTRCCAK